MRISRRKLVGGAAATGVAVAVGGLAVTDRSQVGFSLAQEQASATPQPLGPPIPDEFNVDTNWPYENLNLQGTRDVKATKISSSTVGQLGVAWTFPVSATAAFGALTANPTIVGDTFFVQDAAANIYALKKATGEKIWANMYNDTVPSGGPNGTANA